MSELLHAPVRELASWIRTGRASPTEVVAAHVRRLQQVNPYLNAVVQPTYDRAFAEARAAEHRLAHEDPGTLPPLLGVPCTIKEHYKVAGLPNTAGLLSRRHAVADVDATPVARMRAAGLIVLGTTNVPEALTWYETTNPVYGTTGNPWDVRRIPGGSSGGESAAIGAGGSPVGLGGDVGGSIRNPAFFCGVAGHKPSGGVVAETGAWPGVNAAVGRIKVVGPLGRCVDDLAALMPVLAGPDGHDPSIDDRPWGEAPTFRPEDVTVYWTEKVGLVGPSPGVRRGLHETVRDLEAMGFRTERWTPPGLDAAYEIWAHALTEAGDHGFADQLADFGRFDLADAWRRWATGRSRHILPCLVLATAEAVIRRMPERGRDMAGRVPALQRAIEDKLGDRGVWMLPPFHREAPRHGAEALAAVPGFIYCAVVNPMELPATAVPVGFGAHGMPVGVQIAGRRWNDHLTLWVARQVEEARGRWRMPDRIRGTPV